MGSPSARGDQRGLFLGKVHENGPEVLWELTHASHTIKQLVVRRCPVIAVKSGQIKKKKKINEKKETDCAIIIYVALQTVIVEVRFAINDHFKHGFPARINTAFADCNVPHSTVLLSMLQRSILRIMRTTYTKRSTWSRCNTVNYRGTSFYVLSTFVES